MSSRGYVVYWSQLFLSLHHDATLLCMCYIFTLFTCACDDGATTWYHWKNTIKGGSSFLFTIGNDDFELNTSVILSASGNILFSKVFTCIVYMISIFQYTEIYLFSKIWSIKLIYYIQLLGILRYNMFLNYYRVFPQGFPSTSKLYSRLLLPPC